MKTVKPAKFSIGEQVYVKTQKGVLDKKSMTHSWTPFTLTITNRKLVFGFWKYKVKSGDSGSPETEEINKWFYEDELKHK